MRTAAVPSPTRTSLVLSLAIRIKDFASDPAPRVVAPELARAEATTLADNPTGAASADRAATAATREAEEQRMPRFWKYFLTFSIARPTRIFAAASEVPRALPTSRIPFRCTNLRTRTPRSLSGSWLKASSSSGTRVSQGSSDALAGVRSCISAMACSRSRRFRSSRNVLRLML